MFLRVLRTILPATRCVIPLIPETGSPALRARTTSRKITSPSPRTTTSTSAQDARILLSCTVAWIPPRTVITEGFQAFTRRQTSRADRKLSDMAVTPTTAGSRRRSVSSSFPMGSGDGSMSRSSTSTGRLSCNRTAARLRSPSGGSSDRPVKTGFTKRTFTDASISYISFVSFKSPPPPFMKGGLLFFFHPPLQKGDRGRIPSGCAAMSGSFLTGPPRYADQGGKEGDLRTIHWPLATRHWCCMGGKTRRKLWSGRFTEETDRLVEVFTASLPFDMRLYDHDIEGSIAHCRMLEKQGIIPPADAGKIIEALAELRKEIGSGE